MKKFFLWLKEIIFDETRREYIKRRQIADELDETIWRKRVHDYAAKYGASHSKKHPLTRHRETKPW